MSWAAHDLEPYLLRAKLGARICLPACLLGSYSPDVFTKWFVYGVSAFGVSARAANPTRFHRGWPGAGFTHSYAFGALLASVVFAIVRNRTVALSFLVGQWLHVTTDMLDALGVMAWFPFSTGTVSVGAYAYAGELGRLPDAHAYYTSLGGAVDLLCAVLVLLNFRVLTKAYFERNVLDSDPAFVWLRARIGVLGCRTLYVTSAFFGITSVLGWLAWAVVRHRWGLDWHWGAPAWAPHVSLG